MKRLLNGSVMFLFFNALLFASCQNETSEKKTEPVSNEADFTLAQARKNTNVKITCDGVCTGGSGSCQVEWTPSTGMVTCSCSGCVMKVTETKGSMREVRTLKKSQFEVYYLKSLQKYMDTQYPGQKYDPMGYEFITDGKENVETYTLEIGGKTKVIVIVGDAKRMNNPVTVTYDCSGTCDCRPVYNLNTGKGSCSCKDCSLKTTTIKTDK